MKILLVDDRQENVLALESVLESLGERIITARSGRDALRQVLAHDFAVILLDVQMPIMDGFETAALIRSHPRSRHTPIIFLTAVETSTEHVASGYANGAVDYVCKPFVPEILRAKVSVFVELARKTDLVRRQAEELERANRELQAEIAERQNAEQALAARTEAALGMMEELTRSNARLEAANQELDRLYQRLKDLDGRKTQFFANVSHELRTPLTLILSPTLDRLSSWHSLDTEQRHVLELIERNARILLEQVDNLLEISKLEAGKVAMRYERVNLAERLRLIADHFEVLSREKGVRLEMEAPPEAEAEADAEKLQRVLLNLLSNAFKFTPAGGSVRCRLAVDEQSAVIEVADTGPGIPAEYREAIFERFRQIDGGSARRHGGTGLGLAIAREFIELHGGDISVADAPGGGALFRATLPLRAPAGLAVAAETAGAGDDLEVVRGSVETLRAGVAGTPVAAGGGEANVLVVEDNPEMSWFIARALAARFRVSTAPDGESGARLARELQPDVILVDLMMPGVSGEQMIEELRRSREFDGVPVLVLTAKADEALRLRLLANGVQDYLTKPFLTEELRARVANLAAMKRIRELLQREVSYQERDVVALVRDLVDSRAQLRDALQDLRASEEALRGWNAQLEARIRERTAELSERNAQLEMFAYSIAHDIRAPLRTMRGFADALVEDCGYQLDGVGLEHLRRIVQAVERMDALTEDLLVYSSLARQGLKLEPVEIEAVVRECLEAVSAEVERSGALISVELPCSLPPVAAHHGTLCQALLNLLTNALKFVEDGRPFIRVAAAEDQDTVRISVTDNGIGIAPEYQEKVFELFERLHGVEQFPGTGVGLAIVRKAAERMGGRAGVRSEAGQGSTFWLELPKREQSGEERTTYHLAG